MAPRTAIAFLIAILSFTCIHAQEHFLLYLRWPGGICSKGECCFPSSFPRQDDFLVEFLARSNGTGSLPACSQTRFFFNELIGAKSAGASSILKVDRSDNNGMHDIQRSLLDDLEKHWPSLTCPSDNSFRDWENIWDINGVCTGLSEIDYFTKALALRASANLLNILAKKGITPSNDLSYALTDVEKAISEALGGLQAAEVHCGSTKTSIIRNVKLCVDKTATNFIDCPNKQPSVCAETVKLLTIPKTSLSDEL